MSVPALVNLLFTTLTSIVMIEHLPAFIPFCFALTTFLSVWFFSLAARHHRLFLGVVIAWMVLQGVMGLSKFYLQTHTTPPRVALMGIPPLVMIALMFLAPAGRKFTDNLDPKWLTLLHTVRIPVELVLLGLYLYAQVPRLMTFEGRNFDIIAGLSAPFIAYYGYVRRQLGRTALLWWNFICLALLLNIVTSAILSLPFAYQRLGFEQPNVAILYFPFVWLPSVIVPLVMYAHLAAIRQLLYAQPVYRSAGRG